MNTACRELQGVLRQSAIERTEPGPELALHLRECPACADVRARILRLYDALASLPRHSAPAELDGLVVAATQAGQRQERALAHLRVMLRHEAPAGLESRLAAEPRLTLGSGARLSAPAVLDRLVDEELRDPAKAMARRYVSRLERLGPPASLRERVAHMLQRPGGNRRGWRAWAVAALLLVVAGGWTWRQLGREPAPATPGFTIEYVDDLNQLDPMARQLLFGATGGWSELRGKEHL